MIDVLTIEREYGSGAVTVAQKVAERLGWELWDQALTDEIARHLECDRGQVQLREEVRDPLYYRLFKSFLRGSYEGSLTTPNMKLADADGIRQASEQIIRRIADKGKAVIMGRGSAYYLHERHSAAMAAEILIGKTILEALNTDLVCDAINTSMRELFLQIVYGRTQTAFSEGGLPIGAGLEDLGKGLRSQIGTMYGTLAKGPRYLEMAEGYVTRTALDENNEIIGYEFVHLGKMMDMIKKGIDANEAVKKATSKYGRFDEATKLIDPRQE